MKSKRLMSTILAFSVISTTFLGGCGDKKNEKENDEEGANSNKPKMDKEQYLNLFAGEPTVLDPTLADFVNTSIVLGPIHDGLTRVIGTEEGIDKIEPAIAERWESNDDSTEFTFHLRKNATWSDGTPITAQDFEYSMKRLMNPRTASDYIAFFNPFIKGAEEVTSVNIGENGAEEKINKLMEEVGVKAVDDYTLKFTLVKPTPYFLQLSYLPSLKPVQKASIEKYGSDYGTEADKIMCSGPFVLKEWVHNGQLVFEKNENYWDKDNVYLDKMTWLISSDSNSKMNALFNGQIDRGQVTDSNWKEKFENSGEFLEISKPSYNMEVLVFNPVSGPFKNKKIRQAFAASFDREEYSRDMVNGNNIPSYDYVPSNIVLGEDSFQGNVKNPKYTKQLIDDVKDTKALLIEGMKEEGLGDDPSKLKVVMCMRGDTEWARRQGEWFQNKWKEALGLEIEVQLMKYQIMYDRMKNHDFDLSVGGWVADFDDPSTFLDIYSSDSGYYSYIGWKNEDFDNAIREAGKTTDLEKRAELYTKAEKIITYDDLLITPFEQGKNNTYQKNYIKDYNEPGLAYFCMDFKGVYTEGRK